MSAALTLEGVHTHIGRYHILQGVDFDAPAGQTTMLLGRNGAGKTTTLRTVMGLWRASKGRIALGPTPLQNRAASDVARLGVGYAPETMAVFSDLSVKENLVLGRARGSARRRASCLDLRLLSAAEKILAFARRRACPAARSRCCRSRAPSSSRESCC